MRLDVMYWEWSGNYLHSKWDGACSIEDEGCVTVGELAKVDPKRVGPRAHGVVASRAALSARAHTKIPLSSIIYTKPNANKHNDCATPS